jgi:hypothetical protein
VPKRNISISTVLCVQVFEIYLLSTVFCSTMPTERASEFGAGQGVILPDDRNIVRSTGSFLPDLCTVCLWDGIPEELTDQFWVKKIRGLGNSAHDGCVSCQLIHLIANATITNYDRHLEMFAIYRRYEIGLTDHVKARKCFKNDVLMSSFPQTLRIPRVE